MKERFIPVYTNTMVFISGISLFFYLLSLSGIISIPNLIPVQNAPQYNSLGIYHSLSLHPRNLGMFWEPGAFAGYIILAFGLNIQNFNEKFKLNKTKFIILGAALISTLSTTGYIVFSMFLIVVSLQYIRRNWFIGLLVAFIIFPLIYTTFKNNDFLLEKIVSQYDSSIEKEGKYDPSRIGALLFDIHYIKKHPLTGNGLHQRTRYADHPHLWGDRVGHGNGFSNFIASMGLIGMFFFLYMLYKSLPYLKRNKIIFVVLIILLLQGEQFLNYPLLLGLPFLNSKIVA
ncbi:MAG: O-antigen ligase family protein [Bacteroidales bacterium]|nr:O-antigen ligase family protein [Bacteroidales bacterium]